MSAITEFPDNEDPAAVRRKMLYALQQYESLRHGAFSYSWSDRMALLTQMSSEVAMYAMIMAALKDQGRQS